MIFPLPIATFEELMLNEDRPAYPFVIFFRLRFAGRLSAPLVETATQIALARHPLLRARIRRRGRRGWDWVAVDDPQPRIEWRSESTGDGFPAATTIDLEQEIGTRLLILEDAATTDVIFQFHHANCDGLGAFSFLSDWLVAYARELGGDHQRLTFPPLNEELLHGRGRFGLTWRKFLPMLRKQLVGLKGVRQFLMRQPQPLFPHTPRPSSDPPPPAFPAVRTHRFSVDETTGLQRLARERGVTVNDQLICQLLLGIGDWQRSQQVFDESHWTRLMIPMSLRGRGDQELPAANVVSSIFIDRQGRDHADEASLLQSIHDEMQLIKRNGLGLTFILSLEAQKRLPGGLQMASRGEKCKVSSVLTNLGTILPRCPLPRRDGRLQLGDATLEAVDVLAPLAPAVCATFAVLTYADRLSVAMHYDARVLAAPQAETLLAAFRDRVRSSCQLSAVSCQPDGAQPGSTQAAGDN